MSKRMTADRWPGIIAAQEKSGEKISEYCKRKNICRPSFFHWRKRLKETSSQSGFKRIDTNISPVVMPQGLGNIRIWTPNGYQIESNECKAEELKRVLEVVSQI